MKQAQKEQCVRRLEQRRALVDKEYQPDGENPQGGDANDDPTHEVGTQTFLSKQHDIGTQTSNSEHCVVMSPHAMFQQPHNVPIVCYVPVKPCI